MSQNLLEMLTLFEQLAREVKEKKKDGVLHEKWY